MECFVLSRSILGLLCLVHLFINYAGAIGAYHGHVSKDFLSGAITDEFVLVSLFVAYDNMLTPPHDGWGLAIAGYLLVYLSIFITWAIYCVYAVMDDNKIYEMTLSDRVNINHTDYLKGTVIEEKHPITVYLPCSQSYDVDNARRQRVKFKEVTRGMYIVVSPA